jgi:hypothetical protein
MKPGILEKLRHVTGGKIDNLSLLAHVPEKPGDFPSPLPFAQPEISLPVKGHYRVSPGFVLVIFHFAHRGSPTHVALHQTLRLEFSIGVHHGASIDSQILRKMSIRRQAVVGRQLSGKNFLPNGRLDLKIERHRVIPAKRNPHGLAPFTKDENRTNYSNSSIKNIFSRKCHTVYLSRAFFARTNWTPLISSNERRSKENPPLLQSFEKSHV